MLEIKISTRRIISWISKSTCYDTASDQYTRILMPIVFIFSFLILGFSYFNDKLNCFVNSRLNGRLNGFKEFVEEKCWTQGLYIYHEMLTKLNESSYYGIPEDTSYDGTTQSGRLCSTFNQAGVNFDCIPMTKRYISQCQWVPFYMISLAIFYYFPHLIFKSANSDIMSLVDTVTNSSLRDVDKIANNYFNYKINSKLNMKRIVRLNLVIKIIFILVNITGYILTDYVMDGRFFDYGYNWLQWNNAQNHYAHNIVETSTQKADHLSFPSMGMCDINSELNYKREIYFERHLVICEISQNVRYKYNFRILWFFIVVGFVVSTIGFINAVFQMVSNLLLWTYYPKFFKTSLQANQVHTQLTLREMEYLKKIKEIDMAMYGGILRELTRFKSDIQESNTKSVILLPEIPVN